MAQQQRRSFKLPPGLSLEMFPDWEEFLNMTPLPGMEAEFELALRTVQSVCDSDFTKPIDQENVCGHKAPGIEMKEGWCLRCYEEQSIDELKKFLDLSDKVGLDAAMRMMDAPPAFKPSTRYTSEPSTSGTSSSKPSVPKASTSGVSTAKVSTSSEEPSPKKEKKTTVESEKKTTTD